MFRVSNDLRTFAVTAGEALLFELQLLDANSQALDLPDNGVVLTLYNGGTRAVIKQEIGSRRQDGTGEYFRWAFAGTYTEDLYGQAPKIEVARRYLDGRVILFSGDLTIGISAASVPSLAGAAIGDLITRISIKASAILGGTPTVSVSVRPYEEPLPPAYAIRNGDVVALIL